MIQTKENNIIESVKNLTSNPNEPFFHQQKVELPWLMSRFEKYTFLSLLEYLKPKTSIEIGTYKGGSLQMISQYSDRVYCLDLNSTFVNNLEGRFNNVSFKIGDSKQTLPDLVQQINNGEEILNFVLIDGNHTEKGVRTDINEVLKLVPKEPVYIIMHDSFNPACRRGILTANWEGCPYVHYVEIDYVPGVYHYDSPEIRARSMWGGFSLAILLPEKNKEKLSIFQSQRALFKATFKMSSHRLIDPTMKIVNSNKVFRKIYTGIKSRFINS